LKKKKKQKEEEEEEEEGEEESIEQTRQDEQTKTVRDGPISSCTRMLSGLPDLQSMRFPPV
jgi:hypothetical protein